MKTKKVRAIERGYFGGKLRNAGDVFEVAEQDKAAWFVPEGDLDPPKPTPSTGRKPANQSDGTKTNSQ